MSAPTVKSADLVWMEGDQPFSSRFDDVYFSRDSGLEETRHVFLTHNRLAERWRAMAARRLRRPHAAATGGLQATINCPDWATGHQWIIAAFRWIIGQF